jgi:1,4-alpha-glucan branching enzyme/maltooligosyltrehalose trehalohydrolase
MPFGAAVQDDGSVRFRLWAPGARQVELKLNSGGPGRILSMQALAGGWYELATEEARPGSRYMFVIDGDLAVPDPASRDQAGDVHGWSIVVDPQAFDWQDGEWRGRPWHETVFYELHVGAFTRDGYRGVAEKLDALVDLGVTAVELMPVAEAPGRYNWGYDGVYLFAPEASYGQPDDLKCLIEAAHRRRLMVFLDVVYNHFGPSGNYLSRYAGQFFTDRHRTPWGAAINFDGEHSRVVRDFVVHNALYWLEEYHVDGLRLDAVHAIIDDSRPHVLAEIAAAARGSLKNRHVHLVLENDNNASWLLRGGEGGPGFDAQWNDDLHHALHVAVTGQQDGYYCDYEKPIGHLGRALTEGFAYQGETSAHRGGVRRGEPSRHLPPTAFVSFLQNHDQVGNNATGARIHRAAPAEAVRAAAAIYLLAPSPPLLFMGEEWAATSPFPFFCDFDGALAESVREGRRAEFARFAEFQTPDARARIPDPVAPETFLKGRLDWSERERSPHRETLDFYRSLLDIRAREIVPRLQALRGNAAAFATAGTGGLQAHWTLTDGSRLTLWANLAGQPADARFEPATGRLLFATHPDAADGSGALPAWSVTWRLQVPP